ncbi:MAG: hypothetical protein HC767_14580 [Akkermansiaceae bacterium]|nr:hypothetical protein [Akkermansiaceae bacterium]
MSKSTDNVLLVPGESGWEIWSGLATGLFSLQAATEIQQAGELTDIPSGDLLLLSRSKPSPQCRCASPAMTTHYFPI